MDTNVRGWSGVLLDAVGGPQHRPGSQAERLRGGGPPGMMAGDQFTQIANGLFRDSPLSFKAKGTFGYVSTHRDGWRHCR